MGSENLIKEIEKTFLKNEKGLTIQQILETTGLSRGTVKTYLDELIHMGRIHEEEYAQTKVYFLNGEGKFQQQIQMGDAGVLFVDVMTDAWKNPFVRVKLRREGKDVGAILLNDEGSIDQLIKALGNAKPQIKQYKVLIEKLEQPVHA